MSHAIHGKFANAASKGSRTSTQLDRMNSAASPSTPKIGPDLHPVLHGAEGQTEAMGTLIVSSTCLHVAHYFEIVRGSDGSNKL